MNDFDGLTAVVTGGASGIGAATVELLLSQGANVAVLDRSISVVEQISVNNPTLKVPCDVSDAESTAAAVSTVTDALGGLDILVNNAGIGAIGDISANGDDEWLRV